MGGPNGVLSPVPFLGGEKMKNKIKSKLKKFCAHNFFLIQIYQNIYFTQNNRCGLISIETLETMETKGCFMVLFTPI